MNTTPIHQPTVQENQTTVLLGGWLPETQIERRFHSLHRIASELISETDLDRLLTTIIHSAIHLLAADDGVIFLHRSDLDRLEWFVSVNSERSFAGATLGIGEGLAGQVWLSGEVCQIANYNRWAGSEPTFRERPERSVIGAPLVWRESFIGVLTVSVHRHHIFSDEDVELLRFLAAQASVAIQNARILTENQRRVHDLTVIHETTRSLSRLRLPEALAVEIIHILEHSLAYDFGAVLLIDPETGQLIPFVISNQGQDTGFVEEDKAYIFSREPSMGKGITGWVAEHGESIRLGDVRRDPRYFSVRTDIRSELCVPLLVDGRVIGVINTETTKPAAYSLGDQRLLETVAGQIAIAIQNAQLLEREQIAGQELRHLAAYLQTSLEEERTRISRLIHDNFGQALTALKLDLSWLRRHLPDGKALEAKIAEMSELIDGTINEVRRLSSELRPGILDDLGLPAALEWQAEQFSQRTGVSAQVDSLFEEMEMSADLATALFRISQEALTNIARHAQASQVYIRLESTESQWQLEIQDNGRGFTPGVERSPHSLGLMGMRERILPFRGRVHFIGQPGEGMLVRVSVPHQAGRPGSR